MGVGPSHHRGRVGQADGVAGPGIRDPGEGRDLCPCRHCGRLHPRLIGARQVRHQPHRWRHRRSPPQTLHQSRNLVGVDAESVHAGVHLQPHRQRAGGPRLFQRRDLPAVVDHNPQTEGADGFDLRGRKRPLQQGYGSLDARLPQMPGLPQTDHGELLGTVIDAGQGAPDLDRAVAIGIGLDHRHHHTGGRRLPDLSQIVQQRLMVDHRPQRARRVHQP